MIRNLYLTECSAHLIPLQNEDPALVHWFEDAQLSRMDQLRVHQSRLKPFGACWLFYYCAVGSVGDGLVGSRCSYLDGNVFNNRTTPAFSQNLHCDLDAG